MKIKNRFGKDEFQNMIEWIIGLLGPSIVSKIYSYDSRNSSSHKRKNGKTAGTKCLEMIVATID